MSRRWRTKTAVLCICGWRGKRANIYKKCPACGFYYPHAAEAALAKVTL